VNNIRCPEVMLLYKTIASDSVLEYFQLVFLFSTRLIQIRLVVGVTLKLMMARLRHYFIRLLFGWICWITHLKWTIVGRWLFTHLGIRVSTKIWKLSNTIGLLRWLLFISLFLCTYLRRIRTIVWFILGISWNVITYPFRLGIRE